MADTPVLERLTASDLSLVQWDHFGCSSNIDGLAILDGTRLALVSAITNSDAEQRSLQQSLGAAALDGRR